MSIISHPEISRFPHHVLESLDELTNRVKNDGGKILLLGITGSRMYGTFNDSSDYDIRGIYLANNNDILGLKKDFPHYQVLKDDLDIELIEAKSAFNLLSKGNPNWLEIVKNTCLSDRSHFGDKMLEGLRATKVTVDAFRGMMKSDYMSSKRGDAVAKRKILSAMARNLMNLETIAYQGKLLDFPLDPLRNMGHGFIMSAKSGGLDDRIDEHLEILYEASIKKELYEKCLSQVSSEDMCDYWNKLLVHARLH